MRLSTTSLLLPSCPDPVLAASPSAALIIDVTQEEVAGGVGSPWPKTRQGRLGTEHI
jgi:hypothetical protein